MQITFDTNELTDTDRAVLTLVLGGDAPAAPAAKKTAAPAAKKTSVKPEAEAEAEPDADDSSDDEAPTLETAVALATKLVQGGKSAEVKASLTKVGAKRVSEVDEDDIPKLLKLLNAI